MSLQDAHLSTVAFLAFVSWWRVALYVSYMRRSPLLGFWHIVAAGLLPLTPTVGTISMPLVGARYPWTRNQTPPTHIAPEP